MPEETKPSIGRVFSKLLAPMPLAYSSNGVWCGERSHSLLIRVKNGINDFD